MKRDTRQREERPIWIDVSAMREVLRDIESPATTGVMMALLNYTGSPYHPFRWEPAKIAAFVNTSLRKRDHISVTDLESMRPSLLKFFVELPDGRWVPNPALFSATDGNPGAAS
jgi:hypothetical protein